MVKLNLQYTPMKKSISTVVLLASLCASQAVIWNFDLSPAGTDHAVGLSSSNEVPVVTNSVGSGNEIGSGITFDTSTLTLSLSVGYGSAFGFSNLTGPAIAMHIHGPAPTNVAASVLIDLSANNTPAANPTNGGFIGGTVTYTADQAAFLLAGSNYINIHTTLNPGGEIRAQLIPTNNPPTVSCPAPGVFECDGSGGRLVALTAQVGDLDGDALAVTWTVDGAPVQTNNVPAGAPPTSTPVSFMAFLALGQHQVVVSVSDGKAPAVSCSSTQTVVDTTPPVILSATATPNVLWPPNHKMVQVSLSVVATDICSSVSCRIKNVTANEPIEKPGKGHKSPAWTLTGPLTVQLRAERLGHGSGRTYTITVECTDSSGNASTSNVIVRVPHDQSDHSAKPGKQNGAADSASASASGSASASNSNSNSSKSKGKGH